MSDVLDQSTSLADAILFAAPLAELELLTSLRSADLPATRARS